MNTRICLSLFTACLLAGCDTRTEQPTDATRSGAPSSTQSPARSSTDGNASSRSNTNATGTNTTPGMNTPATPNSSTPRDTANPAAGVQIGEDARILSLLSAKDAEEVKIGKLAQTKATSSAAKSYADMLVKDHSDHADQVASIAKSANITLTTPQPSGEDPSAALNNLSNADFDRKFGELMAKGHQDLISQLQAAQVNLKNAEVKALVDKTLPTLRHHLEMAQSIAGATDTSPSTPNDGTNPPVTPPTNPNPAPTNPPRNP